MGRGRGEGEAERNKLQQQPGCEVSLNEKGELESLIHTHSHNLLESENGTKPQVIYDMLPSLKTEDPSEQRRRCRELRTKERRAGLDWRQARLGMPSYMVPCIALRTTCLARCQRYKPMRFGNSAVPCICIPLNWVLTGFTASTLRGFSVFRKCVLLLFSRGYQEPPRRRTAQRGARQQRPLAVCQPPTNSDPGYVSRSL